MKIAAVSIAIATTLSIVTASKLHRVPIERIYRSPSPDSTSQHVERTLARYTSLSGRISTSDRNNGQPISRIYRQKFEHEKSDQGEGWGIFEAMAPRRSKQIDSERVPIEYNPSEVAFVGLVGIGTPNQYFNLEFDIASSDTWVTGASANCSRDTKCSDQRPVFYPRRSDTFESKPNISWTLDLSDGMGVNGTLTTDTVQVAALACASEKEIKVEGELLFGGRDRARYYGEMGYYNVPKGSAYWSTPVESITVVSNKLKEGCNERILKKDQVTALLAGSTSKPKVIFDTSTDIILLPPSIARDVHRYIHNYLFGFYSGYSLVYGMYTVSCDLGDMDTDIWIDFGPTDSRTGDVPFNSSVHVPLSPPPPPSKIGNKSPPTPAQGSGNKYVTQSTDQQPVLGTERSETQNTRFRISGRDLVRERVPIFSSLENICFSGIQASKSDDDDWVFGNIWFMNNYMTLDHQHRQVGVAAAVQS
ncbi:hypothetical protein BGX26_006949 [Mortierella sp. AD094]|nr:hypothetical protein BGX26_006949 [Mortierella sp. AD094]